MYKEGQFKEFTYHEKDTSKDWYTTVLKENTPQEEWNKDVNIHKDYVAYVILAAYVPVQTSKEFTAPVLSEIKMHVKIYTDDRRAENALKRIYNSELYKKLNIIYNSSIELAGISVVHNPHHINGDIDRESSWRNLQVGGEDIKRINETQLQDIEPLSPYEMAHELV